MIEEIRARHEETHRKYTAQGITLDGAAVPRAHVDRATLLRLLDAAREDVKRLEAALQAIADNADISIDTALFRTQAGAFARAALAKDAPI
jgi:hypothetical protein